PLTDHATAQRSIAAMPKAQWFGRRTDAASVSRTTARRAGHTPARRTSCSTRSGRSVPDLVDQYQIWSISTRSGRSPSATVFRERLEITNTRPAPTQVQLAGRVVAAHQQGGPFLVPAGEQGVMQLMRVTALLVRLAYQNLTEGERPAGCLPRDVGVA